MGGMGNGTPLSPSGNSIGPKTRQELRVPSVEQVWPRRRRLQKSRNLRSLRHRISGGVQRYSVARGLLLILGRHGQASTLAHATRSHSIHIIPLPRPPEILLFLPLLPDADKPVALEDRLIDAIHLVDALPAQ